MSSIDGSICKCGAPVVLGSVDTMSYTFTNCKGVRAGVVMHQKCYETLNPFTEEPRCLICSKPADPEFSVRKVFELSANNVKHMSNMAACSKQCSSRIPH